MTSQENQPAQTPAKTPARLMPLITGSDNELVANCAARFLTDDDTNAQVCANAAIAILHALQLYLDTGDASTALLILEPITVSRNLVKRHGYEQALTTATTELEKRRAANRELAAKIFEAVVEILKANPPKSVDASKP